MEELLGHLPLWAKVTIPLVISNTGWFIRQFIWEWRVMKKHREGQEKNRLEEEKTREEIARLRRLIEGDYSMG